MKLKLLQIFLVFAAFGWGISIFGVFLPWESAVKQLKDLGMGDIPYDAMLDYWLRMTAGAFMAIGIFILIAAINPKRFAATIPLISLFLLCEGLVLFVYGFKLKLGPIPFYADVAFCFLTGIGIWLLKNEAKKT
jgi:hypothetical protein